MKTSSLYGSEAVRRKLGPTLRPGGETLTRHLLDLVSPQPGSLVLDAGCGCGATLELLDAYGVRAVGLDLAGEFLTEAAVVTTGLAQADLADLPIRSASLDMVLCECVWNLTDKVNVLAEFHRTLKPGGILLLSDIFARGHRIDQWPVRCCFAQATDLDTVLEEVGKAGFQIDTVEDHSQLLARTAAEFVFAHGSLHKFWQAVTGDYDMATAACQAAGQSRPGLFALVAHR